jgi:predicted TIM-barrel fold metal-dependent hydrolase
MEDPVLDAHAHCGYAVPFEEIAREWERAQVDGGVVFSPVEEIYDRYDPFFTDSAEYRKSREAVHEYLFRIAKKRNIFPYFFVWNDFPSIPDGFLGIKWHRHASEPRYRYEAPECERILEEICRKKLPIVLEEEFANTLTFVKRIAERTVVIIPHMGGMNGGYGRLKAAGIFENPQVWVDTALAARSEVEDFAKGYGINRILFGSDYPFGDPEYEKRKVGLTFSGDELTRILGGNLLRLLGVKSKT